MTLLLLTDRRRCRDVGRSLRDTVAAAVDAGLAAEPCGRVVLREKDLSRSQRARIGASLAKLLPPGHLVVASDPYLSADLGAGVHLATADRWPADPPRPLGRSCHGGAELAAATAAGADYATLSPMWPTPSKPGYGPPLRPGGLAAALAAVPAHPPVYALGGVTAGRVAVCRAAGAAGVAVLGAVMGAADPARAVRDLLRAAAW